MSSRRKSHQRQSSLYSCLQADVLRTIDAPKVQKGASDEPFPESFLNAVLPHGDKKEIPNALRIGFHLAKIPKKPKVKLRTFFRFVNSSCLMKYVLFRCRARDASGKGE